MYIRKKRIRSLASNICGVKKGQNIVVALRNFNDHIRKLHDIGFTKRLETGENILPKSMGTVSAYNAEGKFAPDKTKPMETAYRQAEWTWQEFRGRYDTEERSKIVEIPYQRYPRDYYKPPSIELEIATSANNGKIVVTKPFIYDPKNEYLLHTVNLFLELFGECEILDENLETVIHAPLKRLNWEVLPPGKKPWVQLEPLVHQVVSQRPEGNQVVINKRIQTINEHEPEFVAIGKAGFSGYLIFGFPAQNIYVLESTEVNNATYILEKNWEEISALTKAEILQAELHKDRVIHREGWFKKIHTVLKAA